MNHYLINSCAVLLCGFVTHAGELTGTFTEVPPGTEVNLTSEGTADWVHWGLDGDMDVNRKAGFLRQKLEGLVAAHPDVFESVRGSGLMLGLKCKAPNADVIQAAYAQEVLTVPAADNVVRLLPALNISEADMSEAVDRLSKAATKVTVVA